MREILKESRCFLVFRPLSTRVLEREVLLQDPESVIFVQALRDLKDVNTLAHAQTLDPNYRDIVMKLENSVNQLHEQFKMPITPKLHIVLKHLPEYFQLKGKTLLKKSDQTIEATHSKFDKFVKVHNYQVRDVESDKAGENLLRAVKHFNSYNLGSRS